MTSGGVPATCDRLRQEPLFQFSLHAKELFHSNFLAWFIDAHPQCGRQAFAPWVAADRGARTNRVRRERSNLDLAVELEGLRPFVIENKVFSPPDTGALQ